MIHQQFHADLRKTFNGLVQQRRNNRNTARMQFHALRVSRHAALERNDDAAYQRDRTQAMVFNMSLQNSQPSSTTLRHLHLALAFLNNTHAGRAEGTWPRNKPIFGRVINWLTPCIPGLTKHQLNDALGLWWAGQRPKDACATVATAVQASVAEPAPLP